MATGQREGDGSAERLATDICGCIELRIGIEQGEGSFGQAFDAASHRVESMIERQDAHAAEQPGRGRVHQPRIAIEARDNEHARPLRSA
jgi:hypothetical protein